MTDDMQASKDRSRRLYVEVFSNGHYDVADELLAADVINHGPGVPVTVGTEGIKRQAALLRTAFPDLRVTLNDQFGEGDRVVSRWNGERHPLRPAEHARYQPGADRHPHLLRRDQDRPP